MNSAFNAQASTTINAPPSKVWEALTTPEMIKQYLFGAEVVTDWQVGSPIVYRGEWKGRSFEDKGRIIEFTREKRLVSTHWSPLSGVPDAPENYHTVAYELATQDGKTQVTITQDNNASEEEKSESERNWQAALEGLKKLLEQNFG
jgi:uncharacterized protein YndB with AHSA1/START domain